MDGLPARDIKSETLFCDSPRVQTKYGTLSLVEWEFRCHQEFLKAADVPQLMLQGQRLLDLIGFSDFSSTRMSAENPEQALVTTPWEMSEPWRHKDVWSNDLMLQYGATNNVPIFQTDIDKYVASAPFKTQLFEVNEQIRLRVHSFGYHDYYAIPKIAANGNGNVLIAITAKDLPEKEFRAAVLQKKAALHVFARAIDHVGVRRFPDFFLSKHEPKETNIHAKSIEFLDAMLRHNFSIKETARSMGVAELTAKRHFKAIRTALGAHTNHGAVYQALKLGLIDLPKD